MPGITDLEALLRGLSPYLDPEAYVFISLPGERYGARPELRPVASVEEREGLTLVVPRTEAERAGFAADVVLARIVLGVESSLEAVGLTAAVAARLAEEGISANVLAGYHHDHVFVPLRDVVRALEALERLQRPE